MTMSGGEYVFVKRSLAFWDLFIRSDGNVQVTEKPGLGPSCLRSYRCCVLTERPVASNQPQPMQCKLRVRIAKLLGWFDWSP
jgi:hypothetical protein